MPAGINPSNLNSTFIGCEFSKSFDIVYQKHTNYNQYHYFH